MISEHGHFVGMDRHEGVGIKARGGLESNRNTKIRRIAYCQVYSDLNITENYRKYQKLSHFAGKIPETACGRAKNCLYGAIILWVSSK